MTPHDLTRVRFVSDPQISPDGTTVAFVVTTLSEERDEYLSAIWLVDVAGGEPRRFTAGPRRDTGQVREVALEPDQSEAILEERGREADDRQRTRDGGGDRRLIALPLARHDPAARRE